MKLILSIFTLIFIVTGCKKEPNILNEGKLEVTITLENNNVNAGTVYLYKKIGNSWVEDYLGKLRDIRINEIITGVPSTEKLHEYKTQINNGKAVIEGVKYGNYYLFVQLNPQDIYAVKEIIISNPANFEKKNFISFPGEQSW